MHPQSLQPALCCVGSRSLKHQRMFVLSCFVGVLLAIVLRLGTGYRGPEMNGGCHSYLVQDVPCYWVCGRSISAPVTPPPGLFPVAPTHSCNRLAGALARHMLQTKVLSPVDHLFRSFSKDLKSTAQAMSLTFACRKALQNV